MKQALQRTRLGVLVSVFVALLSGCADPDGSRALTKYGVDYIVSQKIPPRMWIPGSTTGGDTRGSGHLYIDFANRNAYGSGVSTDSYTRVVWRVTGMRLVKVKTHDLNPIPGIDMASTPLETVLDGEFDVFVKGSGKEKPPTHSRSAIIATISDAPYSFVMNIVPPGVEIRDGFEDLGMMAAGALIFH